MDQDRFKKPKRMGENGLSASGREGGSGVLQPPQRVRALFVGSEYAGHKTRFLNLRATVEREGSLDARFVSITGRKAGGLIERMPLPRAVRRRLRPTLEAAPFATLRRPDVIWTSATEVLTPFLWAQAGPLRRPMVLDLDCTDDQLEEMAELYFARPPKSGFARWIARRQERLLWGATTVFAPWSNWAAQALMRAGIPEERIRVLPPGVDLDAWAVSTKRRNEERPLRLLFVGADFERKGGDLLLELLRGPLAGRFELDIVTKAGIPAPPGVRVHRAEPNSPALRKLFAEADLFVLPTRADCFGIAAVEAMAAGLPVIMGDVGAARDIVVDGETGWLVRPAADDLLAALERAWRQRDVLPAMGERGRRRAEERFDGERNDREIISLLQALARGNRPGREIAAARSTDC